ncbi:acid-soluble spore protein N [Pseudalkalibacillus caeni]|uniref:Acid-soluble spore protein N n=1 Tax=Exobacillus caeni TaxID=2574798 RepID=A0A5R9F9B3_9BACL|nr:acid-soluble spore protein N [Pseudalkalibacillus caeni]TLS37443.1 acid-soluble spore protein N [Pseudalkalibacillus caeni]
MSNPKRDPQPFSPDHLGDRDPQAPGNKGKKMADKTNEEPDYVPPKGK